MVFLYSPAAHWMGASSCIITLSAKLIYFLDQHPMLVRIIILESGRLQNEAATFRLEALQGSKARSL
jgi:hypothetical protein